MNKTRTACITGANRGIGFEFARQLSDKGWRVFAGYREKSRSGGLLDEATANKNILPVQVNTTDEESLRQLAGYIRKVTGSIDMLINNAGIYSDRNSDLRNVSTEQLLTAFRVNLTGTHLTTSIVEPLLRSHTVAKVINIGSRMGSVTLTGTDSPAYRISKAAENMLTRIQSQTYGARGIVVVVIHPGWVRTDMGGGNASLSVEESVSRMLATIERLRFSDSGRFLNYDGEELPY